MGYLFIAIAAFSVGCQFSLSKLFKRVVPSSGYSDLFFNFGTGILSVCLFAVVCLGDVGFSPFSFSLAAGVALCTLIYMLCNLRAVMCGKLAVFTMFLMLGGMVLPTLYGFIFLHEAFSWFKIAGIVLLLFAMVLSTREKSDVKNSRLFYVLCFIAFVCNGFVSVFSKMHQISENALDTYQFSFWQSVVTAAFSGVLLSGCFLCARRREGLPAVVRQAVGAKSLSLIFVITLIMRAGSVFLLLAAKTVPASVLYPIMTGLSIVITSVCGRVFFKEKISVINAISLGINIVAIVLMIF